MENNFNDFNLGKFQRFINIYINDYDFKFEQDVDLISLLTNKTIEEIEDMDLDEYKDLFKTINDIDFTTKTSDELIADIIISDIKYSAGVDYKPKVKEMFMINKFINKYPKNWLKYVSAIIFKPVDNEGNIIKDYSEIGIERRADIFETELSISILQPYLNILSINLIAKNEVSE